MDTKARDQINSMLRTLVSPCRSTFADPKLTRRERKNAFSLVDTSHRWTPTAVRLCTTWIWRATNSSLSLDDKAPGDHYTAESSKPGLLETCGKLVNGEGEVVVGNHLELTHRMPLSWEGKTKLKTASCRPP